MKAIEMRSMRPQVTRRPERRRERDLLKARRDTIQVIEEIEYKVVDTLWGRSIIILKTNLRVPVSYPGMRDW